MRKMRLSCFGIHMIILHFYFRMFPFSIQNVSGAAHQRFPIKVTFDWTQIFLNTAEKIARKWKIVLWKKLPSNFRVLFYACKMNNQIVYGEIFFCLDWHVFSKLLTWKMYFIFCLWKIYQEREMGKMKENLLFFAFSAPKRIAHAWVKCLWQESLIFMRNCDDSNNCTLVNHSYIYLSDVSLYRKQNKLIFSSECLHFVLFFISTE